MSNHSNNPHLDDIVASRVSRRGVLGGGLAAMAGKFVGVGLGGAAAVTAASATSAGAVGNADVLGLLGFHAIEPSEADEVRVPPGYRTEVLIPWGTPLRSSGPAFAGQANTAEEQAEQIGYNHDGMYYFAQDGSSENGFLCVNHEYTIDHALFPDGVENWDHEKTLKSQNAHGVSVVRVQKHAGKWRLVDHPVNRRYTARSKMELTGPAQGHALLDSQYIERRRFVDGTVNNCAAGQTPWGTYLTCEENFHGYFWDLGDGGRTSDEQDLFDRYGVAEEGFGYQWASTDPAWRADRHPNQPNAFGWVVEIHPTFDRRLPKKRTALGRFKHEDASVVVAPDGRVVVYMGDDERGEYVYKYVSERPLSTAFENGGHPLDQGTLYVGRFDADGTGEWLPLVWGHGPLTPANGFADQGAVLIKTRIAADLLGPTRMDRPEWTAVHPVTGEVFVSLTNNSERGIEQPVNRANPRPENEWGHVLRWKEPDPTATEFTWSIFVLAGPGDGADGSTVCSDAAFGSPDGLAFDPDGRLWIETDGNQPVPSNDQMLAADTITGVIKRFLTGPKECEVTGWTMTPDQRTLFINIQHPGDGDPAVSTWPPGDGFDLPRPATVVITREDGGVIGS